MKMAEQRLFFAFGGRAVNPATCTVVLPPHQRVVKVASDEKTDFAWCQAMVSHFLVVIEACDNGLG